jgi:putative ABC transport system permease protein
MINDKSKANVYVSSASVSDLGFDYFNRIKIRVSSEDKISSVRENITQKGYIVSAISDTVDQTRKIFGVIQVVLLSFGMLALIVSAIGMFNTMTISLLERTQEIAIMKSLGASARDIWSMFLTESVLIGFLGGTMGIGIGYGGTEFFNVLLNLIAKNFGGVSVDIFFIPLWFVFFIIIFSTVVGLVTGFYPAKRAAALDTLEALRYK